MATATGEVEAFIRSKTGWESLPPSVQAQLGNNPKEYDKIIGQFSIRNQLRYRGNLVRHVKKDERRYYEEVVDYSRRNLMLFPYHLSDVVVKGLRITPFQYYIMVLESIMGQERSYDSLPNFTAVDCLRLLGIGRNQYIELMNKTRTKTKFAGFATSIFKGRSCRDLLPTRPVSEVVILPWWVVQVGYITEEDVRGLSRPQKALVDQIIDKGPCPAGQLDYRVVHSLYLQGLLFLDIVISDSDLMVVPPLEGFVMNRVTGDYFETLLYKIFVSMDEATTVGETAALLQIDPGLVKDAVALYCRLGFARKKHADSETRHPSWALVEGGRGRQGSVTSVSSDEEDSLLRELNRALEVGEEVVEEVREAGEEEDVGGRAKKIAFLFDSTLTAYLMMGNLSPSLKKHAVTMFEVGKLAEESVDSLLEELGTISTLEAEGEAGVYFTAALTLRETIASLRYCEALKEQELCLGLDLVRCESLQSLDSDTVGRLLAKNYSLIVCTAPLTHQLRVLGQPSPSLPPVLGPGLPELASSWFKLFLYSSCGSGPPSLLLPKGWKLRCLPRALSCSSTLLVTTWGHEPTEVAVQGVLALLQDALLHSPVLLQLHSGPSGRAVTQHLPFPLDPPSDPATAAALASLPTHVDIESSIGFLTLVSLPGLPGAREEKKEEKGEKKEGKEEKDEGKEEKEMEAVDGKRREVSPACEELGSSSIQLLEEELDTLDSAMAGAEGAAPPARPRPTSLAPAPAPQQWLILDVTYGVPLFDLELNRAVVGRVAGRGIARAPTLTAMAASQAALAQQLLAFIGEQTDHYTPYVAAMVEEAEVPLPTRPVWFDGTSIQPLGYVTNTQPAYP